MKHLSLVTLFSFLTLITHSSLAQESPFKSADWKKCAPVLFMELKDLDKQLYTITSKDLIIIPESKKEGEFLKLTKNAAYLIKEDDSCKPTSKNNIHNSIEYASDRLKKVIGFLNQKIETNKQNEKIPFNRLISNVRFENALFSLKENCKNISELKHLLDGIKNPLKENASLPEKTSKSTQDLEKPSTSYSTHSTASTPSTTSSGKVD